MPSSAADARIADPSGFQGFLKTVRARMARGPQAAPYDLDILAKRVRMPSIPVAEEEAMRARFSAEGCRLVRQEAWDTLSERLTDLERTGTTTLGGMPAALLLLQGAHHDAISLPLRQLEAGHAPDCPGLAALAQQLDAAPEQTALPLVLALAHLRLAKAVEHSSPRRPHLTRAEALITRFARDASPTWSTARCRLTELSASQPEPMIRAYRHLMEQLPGSPQPLRDLGIALSGDLPYLIKTAEQLGSAKGYVWMLLEPLRRRPDALEWVDAERLVSGMKAVLAEETEQYVVNQLAAFCALTMAPRPDLSPRLSPRARATQRRLREVFRYILEHHLFELHPCLWQRGPLPEARRFALRVIAEALCADLADGSSVAFSPLGMYRLPPI